MTEPSLFVRRVSRRNTPTHLYLSSDQMVDPCAYMIRRFPTPSGVATRTFDSPPSSKCLPTAEVSTAGYSPIDRN